jgi:hypothetical protein
MAKGYMDKIDKKTRDRHFPEFSGGKGSHDAIDWSKK